MHFITRFLHSNSHSYIILQYEKHIGYGQVRIIIVYEIIVCVCIVLV